MKDLEALQYYLPHVVTKAIAESEREEGKEWKPPMSEYETVCLFADVSGFTSLTEELCALGADGLEDLSTNLNRFATQLVKLTTRAGGDILKFAGDALMALWPTVDADDPNDYRLRVQRAVQCAKDIQLRLDKFVFNVYLKDSEYRDIEISPDGRDAKIKQFTLRAKLGLGMGKLRVIHLGGHGDLIQRERFEYVALGPALVEAIESEKVAKPGEVVVSKEIWSLVGDNFTPEKRNLRDKRVVVKEWKNDSRVAWRVFDRSLPSDMETERKIWKYVPNAVIPYLVETNDESWAPELRTVTTLFFNLGLDIPELTSGRHMTKLEKVFFEIQGVLLAYEGTINKFLVDDKGATLIAVFGLPPFAHENDPLRGVLSGLKVLYNLERFKLHGAVGIATGLAFCGIIGHAAGNRREYSVIGDSVNLAARLMSNAQKRESALLIDRTTKTCLNKTVLDFIPIAVEIKGKKDPVQCYQIGAGHKKQQHDYHSVQLARLSELSKYNVVILDKNRQKTRRRGTKVAVSSPDEMRSIEEQQVQAMTDTRAMMEKRRERMGRKQKKEDAKMTDGISSTPSSSGFPSTAKITYKAKSADDSTTVHIDDGRIETVLDLIEAAIHGFQKKGVISENESDSAFYELMWLKEGSEKVTLKPGEIVSAIPATGFTVLNLQLVHYDSRRGITFDWQSSDENSPEFVQKRLSEIQEAIFLGEDGRIVVITGDHGVGKTAVVERFLFGKEGTHFDDDVVFGYARGNPFESGRSARPFSVWTNLIDDILNSKGGNGMTKEDQIDEAVKSAKRAFSVSDLDTSDLFLLNKILLTHFPGGDDDFVAGEFSIEEESAPSGKIPTAKKNRNVGARNITGKNGKMNRMKALHVNFNKPGGQGSSAKSNSKQNQTGDSGNKLAKASMETAKRKSLLQRLSLGKNKNPLVKGDGGLESIASASSRTELDAFISDTEGNKVIRLLAAALSGLSIRAPLTIVVDESQCMDTFSWLVFIELAKNWMKSNMLVILLHRKVRIERLPALIMATGGKENQNNRVSVFRPRRIKMEESLRSHLRDRIARFDDIESSSPLFRNLRELLTVETLHLEPRPSKTKDIILNFAKVDRAPDSLIDFLKTKTKGNPLYVCDAVQLYFELGLLVRRSEGHETVLGFPHEEFERLRNIHALPIPLSVEAIAGAEIDKMTLVQQLIVKVAAIIGDVFTLGLIREVFPLEALEEEIDESFDYLLQVGFIVPEKTDQEYQVKTPDDRDKIRFNFDSGWMVEILRKRMLNKQKSKLNAKKKKVLEEINETQKLDYLKKAQGKLEINHEGFLQVRKENPKSLAKPWKPRFCVLQGHELVQYLQKDQHKRLEVIILTTESTVKIEPIGMFGFDTKLNPGNAQVNPLYCFTINTDRWEKKGKEMFQQRNFTLGCEEEADRMQWVFKVQYAIDLMKIQKSQEQGSSKSLGRSSGHGSSKRINKSSVDEAGGSEYGLARRISEHKKEEEVLLAPNPQGNAAKGKGIMSSMFKGRKVTDRASHGVSWGVETDIMTPEAFALIKKPENLEVFWRQDDGHRTNYPSHTTDMFYDCEDLSFVTRNSNGEIDGYIMGKLKNLSRSRVAGLVTACAVLPWARRQSVGNRLFTKYFGLCRAKGCTVVRSNVFRDHSITIAFHRSLGFIEDEDESDFLARAGDDDKICMVKNLNFSDDDDEDIEFVNPLLAVKQTMSD